MECTAGGSAGHDLGAGAECTERQGADRRFSGKLDLYSARQHHDPGTGIAAVRRAENGGGGGAARRNCTSGRQKASCTETSCTGARIACTASGE